MKRVLAMTTAVLLFPLIMFSHGNEQHVIGTVTSISSNSITIQTTANASVTVAITSDTQFFKGNSASSAQELKVGDRVVIHAKKNGDKLEAHTVKFGTGRSVTNHAVTHQP